MKTDALLEVPCESGLHLLVLVGPSKSSAKLIRWAKNLSNTMGANLVALHVENTQALNEAQQEQLSYNIDLARQFGAEVIITSGNDLVSTTLDIARRENITHIIIGKSGKQSFFSRLFMGESFANRLLKESGEIDIYVIEPGPEARQYKKKLFSSPDFSASYKSYLVAALVMAIAILICFPISTIAGYRYRSITFILLFVILILSLFCRIGPVMLASVISALAWDFFFLPPLYTLKISKLEDLIAFLMFFVVAVVTGILISKIQKQERLTREREEKTNALFHLSNELATAETAKNIIEAARENIKKYFNVDSFFFLQDGNDQLKKKMPDFNSGLFSESEFSIAQWVFTHSKKAGKFTDTLSSSEYTFYPLKGFKVKPGVVAVKTNKKFNGVTDLFWETFLTQISNTFEHNYFTQLAKRASLLDESDKLYKALFNSVSHELRIPIAAVIGASDILLTDSFPDANRKELYTEIFAASNRLNRLVENLLNMSRLESGKITPNFNWCDVNDLFNSVAVTLKEDLQPFPLDIVVPSSMPLVKIDFGLMEQAIHNLVYNSCKYSKPKTQIRLKAFYDSGCLIIQEMDRGPGIPPDTLSLLFNKFYRAGNHASGGLGLGLSIAKGFVEAHKGTITVENRQNGGARFTIKIPAEISYSHT